MDKFWHKKMKCLQEFNLGFVHLTFFAFFMNGLLLSKMQKNAYVRLRGDLFCELITKIYFGVSFIN